MGSQLRGGEIIELRSDLGGGKTTFVRGLVRGAGSQDHVVSPTFTLNRIYRAKNLSIYHYDFYRLDDAGILADQLAEAVNDDQSVVIVEWAGIVENVLPPDRLSIELQPTANDPDERQITFRYSAAHQEVIAHLESGWAVSLP